MSDLKATPGARLRAEREQRGLSAQKAADEMHLDAWVIDALESGDYARIGPTVYAKGHLRKYASMLGLPVAEIMSDFEPLPAVASRDVSTIPVGSRHGAPASRVVSPGQAAASLAAAILLIGVMWWQPWQPWQQRTHAAGAGKPSANPSGASTPTASAVEVPEQPSPADADESGIEATPAITAQNYAPRQAAATGAGGLAVGKVVAGNVAVAPATGSPAAGSSVASSPAATTPAMGRAHMRLSFTSDSWVDVRDATGNRTFSGNGSANTVKTIAGNAPLHVYLRSANGVQLEINGRAVAIGPQFFSGDAARFEAGADGVLRRDTARPEQTPARPPG